MQSEFGIDAVAMTLLTSLLAPCHAASGVRERAQWERSFFTMTGTDFTGSEAGTCIFNTRLSIGLSFVYRLYFGFYTNSNNPTTV